MTRPRAGETDVEMRLRRAREEQRRLAEEEAALDAKVEELMPVLERALARHLSIEVSLSDERMSGIAVNVYFCGLLICRS